MPDPKHPPQPKGLHAKTGVLTRGFDPALSVGSARPAVFRSSTYVFPSPEAAERAFDLVAGRARPESGESVALIYSRFNHPNAEILEEQVVPLEPGATAALVFNTGMSAIMNALLAFLKPGAALVYTVPIYGGTQKLVQAYLEPWGVRGVPVPAGRSDALDQAIRTTAGLSAVLIETPANPTLVMTDIARACRAAAALAPRPIVLVDNTLLGPAFQHPLELGADLVVYSATKYLSGFSDLLGGVVLARDPERLHRMKLLRNLFGTILQPDECWMLNSRLPTVVLRMRRACENAQRIAQELAKDTRVARVLYPTLFDDPEQCAVRDAQCTAAGAMLSLELGTKSSAFDFLRRLRIARNAVSLGGVETLVCHPKTTTHSGFTEEEFAQAGVTDGLVRISIGIEDWRDLLQDFEQALG
jgi:cystathionine beta-lyase/cystathionine gamma-synthase